MRALGHILTVGALIAAFLVAPAWAYADLGAITAALTGSADLVSSATEIQAAPGGSFTILINRRLHPDDEVLANWVVFFEGERDAPLIMEDVSCMAVAGDAAGIEMAESLQSRLAENQMTLRVEEGPLVLSKAEAGMFDVIVLSDEAAAAFGAESAYDLDFVEAVRR